MGECKDTAHRTLEPPSKQQLFFSLSGKFHRPMLTFCIALNLFGAFYVICFSSLSSQVGLKWKLPESMTFPTCSPALSSVPTNVPGSQGGRSGISDSGYEKWQYFKKEINLFLTFQNPVYSSSLSILKRWTFSYPQVSTSKLLHPNILWPLQIISMKIMY